MKDHPLTILRAYELLEGRIAALLMLPLESMAADELQTRLS